MAKYGPKDAEVTLAFVNNSVIKKLNSRFRKKDTPTDVLSFPLGEHAVDGKYYLGDIIVSVPQAVKQSRSKNLSLEKELEILIIHGYLHLKGFEHFNGLEEEEKKIQKIISEGQDGR
jgi:probable rRNA maturation factor